MFIQKPAARGSPVAGFLRKLLLLTHDREQELLSAVDVRTDDGFTIALEIHLKAVSAKNHVTVRTFHFVGMLASAVRADGKLLFGHRNYGLATHTNSYREKDITYNFQLTISKSAIYVNGIIIYEPKFLRQATPDSVNLFRAAPKLHQKLRCR